MKVLYFKTPKDDFRFPIKDGVYKLGSSKECEIFLPFSGISKNHCKIEIKDEKVKIIDLGSKNGIYLNGKKIEEGFLNIFDNLQIGKVIAQFIEIDEDFKVEERFEFEEKEKPTTTSFNELKFEALNDFLKNYNKKKKMTLLLQLLKDLNISSFGILNKRDGNWIFLFDPERALPENIKEIELKDGFLFEEDEEVFAFAKTDEKNWAVAILLNLVIFLFKKEFKTSKDLDEELNIQGLISNTPSEKMKEVYEKIKKVSLTTSNVLLIGETGVGKDEIAKIIHLNSKRKDKKFFNLNCSAIPENLLESELFGFKRGSFTGAYKDKEGILVSARGGTVFLNEISELSSSLQSKLLNVLDTKKVLPIGAVEKEEIDVRFIFATNKDLKKLIEEKKFRDDLYYRISTFPIFIPPLRERKEEIPILIQQFINEFEEKGKGRIKNFTKKAIDILVDYPWYGNIRELKNVVEQIILMAPKDGVIDTSVLPKYIFDYQAKKGLEEEIRSKEDLNLKKSLYPIVEEIALKEAIKRTGGNISKMAKILGINRITLRKLLKKHKINLNG